ncbi:hypothetical protein WEI85_17835 [Actinomycetes bacterium KLBMP 9797]
MIVEEIDGIRVEYYTDEEYEAAKERALAKLGLTYEELADQARRRDFCSDSAQLTWVAFGAKE